MKETPTLGSTNTLWQILAAISSLGVHPWLRLNRRWQGRQAVVPVDICYVALDVFIWTTFLGALAAQLLLFFQHPTLVASRSTYWALSLPCALAAAAGLLRRLPFSARFTLTALALFIFILISLLEAGVAPNVPIYIVVLLSATTLFYGLRTGLVALGFVCALLGATAWGWTSGVLPLTLSFREANEMLIDFRSPYVWLRVAVIMLIFTVAMLMLLHAVLQRLQQSVIENASSQHILSKEQELRARAVIEAGRQRVLYRTLFETANDAILLLDGLHFVACNRKAEILFGSKREELVGHTPTEHSPARQPDGADSNAKLRQLVQAASEGEPQCFEWRHQRPDGSLFDAEVSLNRLEGQDSVLLQAIVRDISERKRANELLQKSEARYRELFERNPAPMLIYERNSLKLQAVNDAFAQHYGYSPAEALELTVTDLYPQEERAAITTLIPTLTGHAYVGEWHHLKSDGTCIDIVARSHDIDFSNRACRIAVITDITEHKRAEKERETLQTQLIQAQKMEAIGELAGGVAHDFNNILTSILIQLALLRDEPQISQTILGALRDLETEAKRAAGLTRQLLLFSRRQVMQPQRLDLVALVGDLVKMLRRLIGEHISLELQGAAGDVWIEADPGMIEQVVMNLVVNARDAMPSGGRVVISIRSVLLNSDATRNNPEAREGGFACLSVTDNGCGMEAHTISHIFEPFYTTKAVGKGTGLGLSTVFGIVKQHRGWIEVRSAISKGSTFEIFLPSVENTVVGAGGTNSLLAVPRGHESLLIVEDDAKVRETMCSALRGLGYEICEARNGPAALLAWTEIHHKVSLVVTDIVMPGGLSGLDLVEKLISRKPGLKAILVSGYSLEMARQGAPKHGAIRFLQKPFDAAALGRLVRESLSGK